MPPLKVQEPGESEVTALVVSRGNRLANSIGVIRVPEWKDGFDNARHERTLEGVG